MKTLFATLFLFVLFTPVCLAQKLTTSPTGYVTVTAGKASDDSPLFAAPLIDTFLSTFNELTDWVTRLQKDMKIEEKASEAMLNPANLASDGLPNMLVSYEQLLAQNNVSFDQKEVHIYAKRLADLDYPFDDNR